jgi:hypothetical protein
MFLDATYLLIFLVKDKNQQINVVVKHCQTKLTKNLVKFRNQKPHSFMTSYAYSFAQTDTKKQFILFHLNQGKTEGQR